MKLNTLVIAAILVAACERDNAVETAGPTISGNTNGSEVTFCSCANDPARSGARAQACAELMESVPQQEAVTRIMECREQLAMPGDAPDLCFCVRTLSQDPEIRAACEALLPENPSRAELARIMTACAN